MKTLILCIDRDNDIGEKTGLASPIIGRRACLRAAIELGLKDPAEADTNAIFEALRLYDQRIKEGKDAEVAIIGGHKYLGEKANRAIAEHLDTVIEKVKPDRAELVSDGASDEAIKPILMSRLKLDHVHRLVVNQNLVWEDKAYLFLNLVSDDKVRIGFGVPLTILMILYGIFSITGFYTPQNIILGLSLTTLGLYFLISALRLRERLSEYVKVVKKDLRRATVGPLISLSAVFLLTLGTFYSYSEVMSSQAWNETWEGVILFILYMFPWITVSFVIRITGRCVDIYVRTRKMKWEYITYALQVVAAGFIVYGVVQSGYSLLNSQMNGAPMPVKDLVVAASSVTVGVIIGIATAATYHHFKNAESLG